MTTFRSFSSLLTLGVAIGFASAARSEAYVAPPSWMPMTMLNVTMSGNNLAVQPLTDYFAAGSGPVMKVAPVGTYDPAAAWSVLNGTAYSRRLGWYDPNQDDFYATYSSQLSDGAGGHYYLWIEKIAGSPELKTYAVLETQNPTGPYTPIFGTDGSETKWLWDGMMDHNANAVSLADLSAPNQVFTATYHLYVGDASGTAVSGFGDTTTTWTWIGPAAVPEPATLGVLALAGMLMWRRR